MASVYSVYARVSRNWLRKIRQIKTNTWWRQTNFSKLPSVGFLQAIEVDPVILILIIWFRWFTGISVMKQTLTNTLCWQKVQKEKLGKAKETMLKIDIHTHIIPEHLPWLKRKIRVWRIYFSGSSQALFMKMMIDGEIFREIQDNCWMQMCAWKNVAPSCGCSGVVNNSGDVRYWQKRNMHWICRCFQRPSADIIHRYPKRFIGLGIYLCNLRSLQWKSWAMYENRTEGADRITCEMNGNLNAPELFPVFQAAQELGAAILYIHGNDGQKKNAEVLASMACSPKTSFAICSMIFGGVVWTTSWFACSVTWSGLFH